MTGALKLADSGTGLSPHEMTIEEITEEFLGLVWSYIDYWKNLPNINTDARLEGLAFSLLVILDGGSSLPAFIVAPNPHLQDKEYHISEGGNWYPENYGVPIRGDISGSLHEFFHMSNPKRRPGTVP